MNITVILCTFNRAESLSKALESVASSELPNSVEWEVLVVDNNSSDNTREVTEEIGRRHPDRIRYVFEPLQGKSKALNRGIREAKGDILAFTDDDLTVEPSWLDDLTAELRAGGWAGAGGRILPAQAFAAPRWFALDAPYGMGGVLFAHFDLGDTARELGQPPHGANMAFRKDMFEKYGGFRVDLGPSLDNQFPNEDAEFGQRLLTAGERLRYEPSAVVYHVVPESRLKTEYFLKWWYGYGRSQIRAVGKKPGILGIPRYYLSILHVALGHLPVRTLKWFLSTNPQRRFYRKCMVWVAAGWLVEMSKLAHQDNKQR